MSDWNTVPSWQGEGRAWARRDDERTSEGFFIARNADDELAVWKGGGSKPQEIATYDPKRGVRFERSASPTPTDLRGIVDAIDRWEDR